MSIEAHAQRMSHDSEKCEFCQTTRACDVVSEIAAAIDRHVLFLTAPTTESMREWLAGLEEASAVLDELELSMRDRVQRMQPARTTH